MVAFIALWPWVYLGIPAAAGFWYYVWAKGDWSFASSELALVECEEEGIDYSQAPERIDWLRGGRLAAYIAIGLLLAYGLSGVG